MKDITLLMTDIEGSTALWENDALAMEKALARHDAIVEESVATFAGTLVKSKGEGDSTFSVFRTSHEAIAAALEIQQALGAEAWPTQLPIRIRIAIHSGAAQERADDFFGPVVNRCARLRAAAHGGQVVVSHAVADGVGSALPDGASLWDLGQYRLKDLLKPERIYQLCHPELANDFPALHTLDQAAHNLPIELTSFVGRENELGELRSLAAENRLVTVTGPGGIGKTRLASHAGAEALDDFPDGVRIVYLAPLSEGSVIAQEVAAAIGVREQAGRQIIDSIVDHLLGRRMLVILDNCEHLPDECAHLAEALVTKSPAHLIATSRAPLGIQGERVWQLKPLSLPDLSTPTEELSEIPSVRLLLDRAAMAGAPIEPSLATAAAIVETTHSLAGMPLAIELAAARLRSMSITHLSDRLRDEMLALTRGAFRDSVKGKTLEATLDWSYDLLTDAERALLRRSSIFAGGFTLAAAEQVCGHDVNVLVTLPSLVDRSLVVYDQEADRYRLLEPIRQYAAAKLKDDEFEETERLHFDWCVELTKAASSWRTPIRPETIALLETELDNLRAALDGPTSQANPHRELLLARGLQGFWNIRGHFAEGRRRLTRAIERAPDGDPAVLLPTLLGLRRILRSMGDRAAWTHNEWVESLAETLGDPHFLAMVGATRGLDLFAEGRLDEAEEFLLRVLEYARDNDDAFTEARMLNTLGELSRTRDDYPVAVERYSASVAIADTIGDQYMSAMASANLGCALVMTGDLASAQVALLKSIAQSKDAREPTTLQGVLVGLAAVLTPAQPQLAARLLGASEQNRKRAGETLLRSDERFLDHVAELIKAQIGEDIYQQCVHEGGSKALEEALAKGVDALS